MLPARRTLEMRLLVPPTLLSASLSRSANREASSFSVVISGAVRSRGIRKLSPLSARSNRAWAAATSKERPSVLGAIS